MTPDFMVLAGGVNISQQIKDRLISLEVTDSEGAKSDRCSISLDDRDALVELPPKDTLLSVSMGYRETGLVFMGTFKVSDVDTSGFPRQVSIQAEAADMSGKLKQTRNHAYPNKTIGEIVREIAGRHGLAPQISSALSSFRYPYLPQTGESDMNVLTNLARRHDALFKVANGRMMFMRRGEGLSGLGGAMGVIVVKGDLIPGGSQVKRYSAKAQERPKHNRVAGAWWDRTQGQERRETEDSDEDGPEHQLEHRAPNQNEARAGAQSRANRLKRSKGGLSLELVGNPAAAADMTLVVYGVRPGSADGVWRIKTAKHSLTPQGFSTDLQAELPGEGNTRQGVAAQREVSSGLAGGVEHPGFF